MSIFTEAGPSEGVRLEATLDGTLIALPEQAGESGQANFTEMSQLAKQAENQLGKILQQIPEDGIFDPRALGAELVRATVQIASMAHKIGFQEGLETEAYRTRESSVEKV